MSKLSAVSLSKHYSRKKALDDVSLSFETGHIYALLGENGAGKSTLASLLSGDAEPTSGNILVDGWAVSFNSPRKAIDCGIAMVRQQPLLADELTVWENCVLGNEKTDMLGTLKKKETLSALEKLEQSWSLSLPLTQKAKALTAPERMSASLLANLYKSPRFLILDEPSATLDHEQRMNLFQTLKAKVSEEGLCIIFITHSIQEALDYADVITILQKGRLVFSADITQEKPAVSDIMDKLFPHKESRGFTFAGRQAPAASDSTEKAESAGQPLLELKNVTVRPQKGAALFNISFTVPEGQLTCISGQRESGMDTLENLLTGMLDLPKTHAPFSRQHVINGTVMFKGTPLSRPLTPRFLRENGTAIIPFRKMIRASHPELTIAELLGNTGADPQKILTQVQTDIPVTEKVKALSGGMLQRLIIARELYADPSFVIMSSPSYGLDRFSTEKVTETVQALLKQGATVLVLGEEPALAELSTNCCKLVSGELFPVSGKKEAL